MGIKGDVRSIPLANVLQDLVMNEQTGTLRIAGKERNLALWFERGALRLAGVGPGEGPSLLNGLLALGKIAPGEAPPASEKRAHEAAFVRGLLKKGRVTRDDLKAALERQMSEHLCDAFLWAEAAFEFEEGEPDDRSFDVDQLDLEARPAVDATIMEALRRVDEWGETRKAVLSSGEIFVTDPPRVPADADASVRRVLEFMDGERSLREIQDLTRLGQFAVHRAAAILIKAGAARPLRMDEVLERARARAGRKEWEAAVRMARYGLDHERTHAGFLEIALQGAEETGDPEAAASCGRRLGAAQAEAGALEAAVASYQKVLVHAPRDLTSHERLFDALLQLHRKAEALAAGEALASACKKAGLPDKAVEVYGRLVESLGDQTELLESLAEIQRHLGDKPEAVQIYRKLLARALEAKNDPDALDYCRTILHIDPGNEEAGRIRRRLESGEMERTRRRRRLLKSLFTFGVIAALAGVAAGYEYKARAALAKARPAILEAASNKRTREALEIYDRAVDPFPWSLVGREARPERERMEEMYVAEEKSRAVELERRGLLGDAVRVLESALEMLRRDDLSRELADLRARRRAAEDEWRLKLAKMTPQEVAPVRDPMAVPALEEALAAENRETRLAAVGALGAIPIEGTIGSLIKALADLDPEVYQEAAAHLARRTGQAFGADRLKWEEWWVRTGQSAGRPALQAALVSPRQSYTAAEGAAIEWRVVNLGKTDADFVLEEAPGRKLQILGPAGPATVPQAAVSRRAVRLAPGEFVGGTFDLNQAMAAPGKYRLLWSAALTLRGKTVVIDASPLILERTR